MSPAGSDQRQLSGPWKMPLRVLVSAGIAVLIVLVVTTCRETRDVEFFGNLPGWVIVLLCPLLAGILMLQNLEELVSTNPSWRPSRIGPGQRKPGRLLCSSMDSRAIPCLGPRLR